MISGTLRLQALQSDPEQPIKRLLTSPLPSRQPYRFITLVDALILEHQHRAGSNAHR